MNMSQQHTSQNKKHSVDFPDESVFDNCPTQNHDSQASAHSTQFSKNKSDSSDQKVIEYDENIEMAFSEQINLYDEIDVCKNDSSKMQKYDAFTDQDEINTDSQESFEKVKKSLQSRNIENEVKFDSITDQNAEFAHMTQGGTQVQSQKDQKMCEQTESEEMSITTNDFAINMKRIECAFQEKKDATVMIESPEK